MHLDTMEPMEELNEELYEAIENGDIYGAKSAIANGANVNSINYPYSPLHMAINGKFYDIVINLIFYQDADVNIRVDNKSVLHYACSLDDSIAVEILIRYGADIYDDQCSPLHSCVKHNSFETFARIIQLIPNLYVNVQDENGFTLLHVACMVSRAHFVHEIIALPQCNINMCNIESRTALHICCMFNTDIEIIKLLLDNGAHKNDCDTFDKPPIFYACVKDYHAIVEVLLLTGVFVDRSIPEIEHYFVRNNLSIPGAT